jgi:hypothetical protein
MTDQPEKLLTLSQVAEALGLKIYDVRRARRRGLFPTHTLASGRPRVRLSDVLSALKTSEKPSKPEGDR